MLVECFTSDTLLRVQLDWKCLISKKKKKSSKEIFFFFSPLENIKFRECDFKGNEGGKWKTFWRQELGFCVRLNGFFQSVCNMISCERQAWFALKFQGKFQNPFNFGRSSAGSAHPRLVWKAEEKYAPLSPATLGHLHQGSGGLQPLLLAPRMGHGSCLDPPSNTPR